MKAYLSLKSQAFHFDFAERNSLQLLCLSVYRCVRKLYVCVHASTAFLIAEILPTRSVERFNSVSMLGYGIFS